MSQYTPVFGASGTPHSEGSVPDPGSTAGTSRFLREDATWAIPQAGPPGPPPPSPGPGLDQWACNAAGFILYECCYKLTKAAIDTNFFSLATDAIIGFAFDALAGVLLPLEILDTGFLTWLEGWVSGTVQANLATFLAHIEDQVLWSKFHCFLYNQIRAAGNASNTTLLAAGVALAASGISPGAVTNGIALILQQFGIMTVGPIPLSAFVQNYDCSSCASTGGDSAPIPIQPAFDLIVDDGTHRQGFVNEIDLIGATAAFSGGKATITVPPDLTVTDGTTSVTAVNDILFGQSVVSGTTGMATVTPEVGVQHNDGLVADQPIIDFEDTPSVPWTVTNDGANNRVKVSAAVPKATSSSLGIVEPDNTTITVDGAGVISSVFTGGYPVWYFPVKPPVVASWTQVNTGGLTVANVPGGPGIDGVLAQGTLAGLVRSQSVPYDLVVGLVPMLAMTPSGGSPGCGLWLRESSSGKLVVWRFILNGGTPTIAVSTFSSATVGVANPFVNTSYVSAFSYMSPPMWLRVKNDGSNRTYGIGRDGVNFLMLYSEAAGTYITEDQSGFFLEGTGFSVADAVTCLSWNGP